MLALLHFPVQSGMSLIEALLFPPFSFRPFYTQQPTERQIRRA